MKWGSRLFGAKFPNENARECEVCRSPKVFYEVGKRFFCRDHRDKATALQTVINGHRSAMSNARRDMRGLRCDAARKKHVPITPTWRKGR